MSTRQLLISGWDWEPSVVIGCAALVLVYFALVRERGGKRAAHFVAGVLVLLLALVSPLDTLGDTYLFSAHMLQHLLLMLVVPPLLILGLPKGAVIRALNWPPAGRAGRVLSHPLWAWLLAFGAMAVWHLPILYNAALANESVHVVQHLCFLVTATIFWWPLLAPVMSLRLSPPAAVAYLFLACMANTVVAAIITFAPVGIYPAYLVPVDDLGMLSLIRNDWGISPHLDQQIGGLLMWLPGCAVYLFATLAEVMRWLSRPDQPELVGAENIQPSLARSVNLE